MPVEKRSKEIEEIIHSSNSNRTCLFIERMCRFNQPNT